MTFESMDMPVVLKNGLKELELVTPTPIQDKAIPIALEGKDVLGSAQTGSGKTIAFLLPMLTHLLKPANKTKKALVITPTRELAQQVMTQIQALLREGVFLKVALLIGGDSMFKQLKQLKASPKVIVGTPGRINDHLRRNSLDLQQCDFVVLDETDRMLDMGFSVQIDAILKNVSNPRQTLMFSATFPEGIKKISNRYMQDPVNVAMDQTFMPAKEIKQDTVMIAEKDKYDKLLEELEQRQGSVIIFMKTKFSTDKMAKRLTKEGHRSDAIHGDLRQSRRTKVIESFRKEKFRVLVATDVAARGLDIPHIEHVVNFDLPQCPEDYIHRIGRTGRNGASGFAMNFVSPMDRKRWQAISVLLNPNAKPAGSKSQKRSQSNSRSRKPASQSRFGGGAAKQSSSKPSRFKDQRSFGNEGVQFQKRGMSDRPSRNGNESKRNFSRRDDQVGNRVSETGNSANQRFSRNDQFNKKDYVKNGEDRWHQRGNNSDRASKFGNSSRQGFSKNSRANTGDGNFQSGRGFDRPSRNGNSFTERGDDRFQKGNRQEDSRHSGFRKHDKGNRNDTFKSGNSNERSFRNSDSTKRKDGGFSQKKRGANGFKDDGRRGASPKRDARKGAPIYIKPHVKSEKKSKRETEEVVAVS